MTSTIRKISDLPPNEYPSPAFVKRARLSYGALFEGGFDIFEEDGGVKGRGRKRTRFGRDSSAWRYSSQSPSPEPSTPVPDPMEEDAPGDVTPQPSSKPQMTDEGIQTVEVEMAQPTPESIEPVAPERETTPVPEAAVQTPQENQAAVHQIEIAQMTSPREKEPVLAGPREQPSVPGEVLGALPQSTAADGSNGEPVQQSTQIQTQNQHTEIQQSNLPSTSDTEVITGTLFGPKSYASDFSSFGAAAPAQVESALSLADQVRFGFSHVPQTTQFSSPPRPERAPEADHNKQDPYPLSYLDDAPDPAKYADMNTYLDAADEQDEMAVHGQTMPPEPPVMERFGDGQWEMSTQSPHYNPIEGGHFGVDALNEGARVASSQASLHAGATAPEQVPEGFATYGREDVPSRHQESPPRHALPHEDQPFVENEDTISGDEVGVDDEEDEDEKFDELAYGERIEEGDYDQRNYDIPADDDEGLSDEEDEIELEEEERYGNGEMYDEDEDGEGEEWDEEDDYASEEDGYDEEDYDATGYQPRKPAPAPTGPPVVIDLISDSEDEDVPAPAPRKPAAPVQTELAPEPPTSSEATSSPGPQVPSAVLETVETDSAAKEDAPDNFFSKIHVVDFATLAANTASQQAKVPAPNMDTDTLSSATTSQTPGSFRVSNLRDESYVPDSEPAPSEGSSEGLFVTRPKHRPTSSESSSEGLFSSQLRARSLDTEDKRTDDDITNSSREAEIEDQEQAKTEDESMSVDELEQDETASQSSEEDDGDLPDADDVSFASQVEMVEELAESEDEYMSADDAPAATAVSVESWSKLEVEEITGSEEDVDMIDLGSAHFESASPEKMASQSPRQEILGGTSNAISDLVVTEVVSEVSFTMEEALPHTELAGQNLPVVSSSFAHDQDQAAAELLEGRTGQTPSGGLEAEELASQMADSAPATRLDAETAAPETDKHAESLGETPVEVAPPAEHSREVDKAAVTDDEAISGIEGNGSSAAAEFPEARDDGVVPDLPVPAQSPTVEKLDEDVSTQAPVELSREAKEHPSSPPAEEGDEDETMIMEQLSQEQQQYPESEAADTQRRSSSPDLSVHLARQAVAARRQKKAPEPARSSPRVTRARSSSLRSNATNGTPDKEEDNSVSLAREALASPSKRGAEADGVTTGTTTAAALKLELTKRLRTELSECVPLKSLRNHIDKFPNAIVVATTQPSTPTRAKGGPREYSMSFHVTDPSTAPSAVVEVQLYRPHKDSLPVVKPGDVILLQRFQVKALSKKGFGLRTGMDSAWAVWDGGLDGEGGSSQTSPQIRGPPVEDWEGYVSYVGMMKDWFGLVMADGAARGKLEKADRKLDEAK